MRRTGPISLALPSFGGAVRRLVLLNVAVFFALAVIHWISGPLENTLMTLLALRPIDVIHGQVWQLATYSLIQPGILSIIFGMLTLWFAGSLLEGAYGSRWLMELYWSSVIGGAAVATAVSFSHVF